MKIAFRQMCPPLCGRFVPNEGGVADYVDRIWCKYAAKWGTQMAGMNFQTRSSYIRKEAVSNAHGRCIGSANSGWCFICMFHYRMLLTALLGSYAAFLSMIEVLLIQCLLFADGGLLALGCNIWNMAFYGCFVGYFLIWRSIVKHGFSRAKIIGASILGSIAALQLGAFSVTLEIIFSGITELPFSLFVGTMQPIHLVIGFVEGLITAMVLLFVYEARPQMLQGTGEITLSQIESKFSLCKVITVFTIIALLAGGIFSVFSSAQPDGLEWSIERIIGSTEIETVNSHVHMVLENIQKATAVLTDYSFKGKDYRASYE